MINYCETDLKIRFDLKITTVSQGETVEDGHDGHLGLLWSFPDSEHSRTKLLVKIRVIFRKSEKRSMSEQ